MIKQIDEVEIPDPCKQKLVFLIQQLECMVCSLNNQQVRQYVRIELDIVLFQLSFLGGGQDHNSAL